MVRSGTLRGLFASVCCALCLVAAAPSAAATQYGYLNFPEDEHQHVDGWNYWWGAADLVTKSGNRYTVGVAFDSFYGVGAAGHQILPRQGPYLGRQISSMNGPAEWGHTGDLARFVSLPGTYDPVAENLLDYRTYDVVDGFKPIDTWQRTSPTEENYHLLIDNETARVHPSGEQIQTQVDLDVEMHSPPLLLGGTGQWWYGIPQAHGYPSRSYQYMQAAETMHGTIEIEQPDGSVLQEKIRPKKSTMVMVREYDATPEDLFAGLALAELTQIHPRYAQYYHGGMPWDLLFVDLENGAQLMFAVLAFHETAEGTLTPVIGRRQPTYDVMATVRLPSGESVPIDDRVHVEHLDYRRLVGKVPTFQVSLNGIWDQAWNYRVSFPGGKMPTADGRLVRVPPFDLGLRPQLRRPEPAGDALGNRQSQRVPYLAEGRYGRCPIHGFGWSELIVNWYGQKAQDPWFTGGKRPKAPKKCRKGLPRPPEGTFGDLSPPAPPALPPNLATESCSAINPGTPTCEYVAKHPAGIAGLGGGPGGWTVTIHRPGEPKPIVVPAFSGNEIYTCGAVMPGDRVVLEAQPGAGVVVGNPLICF